VLSVLTLTMIETDYNVTRKRCWVVGRWRQWSMRDDMPGGSGDLLNYNVRQSIPCGWCHNHGRDVVNWYMPRAGFVTVSTKSYSGVNTVIYRHSPAAD